MPKLALFGFSALVREDPCSRVSFMLPRALFLMLIVYRALDDGR